VKSSSRDRSWRTKQALRKMLQNIYSDKHDKLAEYLQDLEESNEAHMYAMEQRLLGSEVGMGWGSVDPADNAWHLVPSWTLASYKDNPEDYTEVEYENMPRGEFKQAISTLPKEEQASMIRFYNLINDDRQGGMRESAQPKPTQPKAKPAHTPRPCHLAQHGMCPFVDGKCHNIHDGSSCRFGKSCRFVDKLRADPVANREAANPPLKEDFQKNSAPAAPQSGSKN
jgi:hypothetical protein